MSGTFYAFYLRLKIRILPSHAYQVQLLNIASSEL